MIPGEGSAVFDIRVSTDVDLAEFVRKLDEWCDLPGKSVRIAANGTNALKQKRFCFFYAFFLGVRYEFLQRTEVHGVSSIAEDDPWWSAFQSAVNEVSLMVVLKLEKNKEK